MEDLEQTLDLEEFIDASMRLYDTLKLPEKNILLNLKDKEARFKHSNESEYTFQPNINKNSLRIAAKVRPHGEDVAEMLYKRKEETEHRLNQMREQMKEEELVGCTFQPITMNTSPYQAAFKRMNNWEENLGTNKPRNESFSMSTLKNSETTHGNYEEMGRYDNYD